MTDTVTIPDVDVLLETLPPTVRAPDIVVAAATAAQAAARLEAAQVAVAIEFVPPGSRRADSVTKLSEYQDAGIPSYWIVDLSTSGVARRA